MKRRIPIVVLFLAVVAGLVYWACLSKATTIVLTGIVTTDEVIVSSEISGRLQQMLVREGDAVTNGQLLAVIQPQEWKADVAYYAGAQSQSSALVAQAEADLKFQEAQTTNQILQAEATLAATQAQVIQAEADLENADLIFKREEGLYQRGVDSRQTYDQARTASAADKARVESLNKQVAGRGGGGGPGQGQCRTDGRAPGRAPGQRGAAGGRQGPGGEGGRAPRATPKFARPAPAWWTRARPSRAKWSIPARPSSP